MLNKIEMIGKLKFEFLQHYIGKKLLYRWITFELLICQKKIAVFGFCKKISVHGEFFVKKLKTEDIQNSNI